MEEIDENIIPYSSLPPRLRPITQTSSKRKESGKKGKGKKSVMINMQLTLYDIEITEIKKRIERLDKRNLEIEEEFIVIEVARSATDAETVEQISKLTKQVRTEENQIKNLKNKFQSLENLLKEETARHHKRVDALNEKYNRKRLELLSKIKFLNAKINSLDDFKRTQAVLQEKLKNMTTIMAKEQEKVNAMLEKIERKFKLDREKLKKEMYNRLLSLAGSFQIEVADSMSPPVHRLLRENIMLRNDLASIKKMYPSKLEIEEQKRMAIYKYQNIIAASSSKARQNMIAIKIQSLLINLLREMNEKTKERLLMLDKSESEDLNDYLMKAERAMKKTRECEGNLRQMEVFFHQEKAQLCTVRFAWRKLHCDVKRSLEIYYDLTFIVACALQMNDTCSATTRITAEQLIPRLVNALDKTILEAKSTHTVRGASAAYVIGDLGFEPKGLMKRTLAEWEFSKMHPIRERVRSIDLDSIWKTGQPARDLHLKIEDLMREEEEEWVAHEDFDRYVIEQLEITQIKQKFEGEDEGSMNETSESKTPSEQSKRDE